MYLQSITQRQSDNKLFTLLISPKKRKRNEFSDSMTYTTQTWPHVKRDTRAEFGINTDTKQEV